MMVADTLFCLGGTYKKLERPNKAMKCFKASIEIREKLLMPLTGDLTDESFIITLQDLPDSISANYKNLIDCYRELLSLLKCIETEVIDESRYLEQIGDIYSVMRRWDDALSRYVM